MAFRVFPTESDVGGSNKGAAYTEENHRRLHYPDFRKLGAEDAASHSPSWVKGSTSFAFLSATGLDATFQAGLAVIGGYAVEEDQNSEVALNASATNYVWLELVEDAGGNKVTSAQWRVETSESVIPVRGILINIIATDATSVTSTADRRMLHPSRFSGTYEASGSGTLKIVVGFEPSRVVVERDAAGIYATKEWGVVTYNGSVIDDAGDKHAVGPTTVAEESITLQPYGFDVVAGASAASLNGTGTHNFVCFR